jgi:hypothetical protein
MKEIVMGDRRMFMATTLRAAAAVVIVSGLVFGGGYDAAGARSASATSTSVAATGRATAEERVARRFVDAYGRFKANRALKLLTKDAIATGAGHTHVGWGSPDAFRSEVSLAKSWHIKQTVTSCENQGDSGKGVTVRCGFDYHALRSDEIGRGPFTDNHWDLVVRDGKITSAVAIWAVLTNGFDAQMWQPFQAWVSSAHPEDVQDLYPVGDPVPTRERMRLWEERTREWVASIKARSE